LSYTSKGKGSCREGLISLGGPAEGRGGPPSPPFGQRKRGENIEESFIILTAEAGGEGKYGTGEKKTAARSSTQ